MRRVGQWHWIALLFGATACDNKHCGTAGAFPRKPPSPFAFPAKMRTGVPVVNETLEGRAGYLKAFTIAVGVFGRYASDRRGSPLRGHRFKELLTGQCPGVALHGLFLSGGVSDRQGNCRPLAKIRIAAAWAYHTT
jgi:hypothetical protein